ncbi:hypothetical protein ACPCSL_10840 [Streptomyces griseoincarnatus]
MTFRDAQQLPVGRVLMDGAAVGLSTGLVGAGAAVLTAASGLLAAASGLLAARWKTEQRPASRCTTALPHRGLADCGGAGRALLPSRRLVRTRHSGRAEHRVRRTSWWADQPSRGGRAPAMPE